MSFEGLTPVADVSAGAWIAPRLCGVGGRVCCVVPMGFAGYVRVLHPAADGHGAPASWAQVSAATGRRAHPLMQWQYISTVAASPATGGGPAWPGHEPAVGDLPTAVLVDVLEVLAGFTTDLNDCYHAVWDGWGWLHRGAFRIAFHSSDPQNPPPPHPMPPPPGLPDEVMAGPRLHHPGRDYLLFHGPLRAAPTIGHQITDSWFLPQSPSLLWPADQSWLLATEIDFDSTLIGGPRPLVDAVLSAPGLEAWPVSADADLTIHGDHVNT